MIVNNEHARNVCRVGQGRFTCSYFGFTGQGGDCSKGSPEEVDIARQRAEGTINAIGDNCSGPPDFIPVKEVVQ